MPALKAEIWRAVLIFFLAFIAGLVFGEALLFMFIVAFGYLVWNFRHIYRFNRYLEQKKKFDPPTYSGLWGEAYYSLLKTQQRHRKRKKKLTGILKRFQKSTEAMPDGVIVMEKNGAIDWWNTAASDLLGLRYPIDRGQLISNLVRNPKFAAFLKAEEFEDTLEIPSPRRPDVMVTIRIVPSARGEKLLLVQDTTRLHYLERMRKDFVANVSHEFRTPLTVVSGFIETMSDKGDECSNRWQRPLELMGQQTRRMQHLVEELLFLSRLENEGGAEKPQTVDVPDMLRALCDETVALSGGKHEITTDIENNVLLIGRSDELRSAFTNLTSNAVRYTPEQGKIQIRWYSDPYGVYLEVEDNGVGIDMQHLPRITERFYRVDVGRSRDMGGTGLGLAIVKHVLSRHEAVLDVRSRVGKGSTFICHFPLSRLVLRSELTASS